MSEMATPQVRRYMKSRILVIRFIFILSQLKLKRATHISDPRLERLLSVAGSADR